MNYLTTNRMIKSALSSMLFHLMVSLSIVIAGMGCDQPLNSPSIPQLRTAKMRIVQGIPNADSLKIRKDNKPFVGDTLSPIRTNSVSTYIFVPADEVGNYRILTARKDSLIRELSISMPERTKNTFFIIDSLQKADVIIVRDTIAIADSGTVFLRLINISPNAPTLNFSLEDTLANRTTYFTNVGFKPQNGGVTSYVKLNLPPFSNTEDSLRLVLSDASTNNIILRRKISLSDGRTYSIFLTNFYNSTGVIGTFSPSVPGTRFRVVAVEEPNQQ